jgi:phage terminase small subunit
MSNRPLTPYQDNFARLVAEGKNQSDAYRGAYRAGRMNAKTINEEACRLIGNPAISARVSEYRKEFAPVSKMTLKQHIEELERLKELAIGAGKFEAAINAEVNRGKASGLYVTKTEDVTDPLKKAMNGLTPEKASEMLDALDKVQAIQDKAKAS